MPNFTNDSDLLPFEPHVFHELPFAGQTKLRITDAQLDPGAPGLTSATGGFNALQPGDVAILGEGAYPIQSVEDDNTLTLASAPVGVTDSTLIVRTLAPQAALAHEHLLLSLELEEDRIQNTSLVARLEALSTLALAYAAGASVLGDSKRLLEKSERHAGQFRSELLGAVIELDTGDEMRPGVATMVRT